MGNLKRFFALAFAVLMIAGSIPTFAKTFSDADELADDEAVAIGMLSDLSIIIGKADGSFGGEDEVTREEMAILAARVQTGESFKNSYGENVTPFADVDANFEAILYASNMGIITGDDKGNFNPYDNVTYQDAIAMIVRTLGYKGIEMDAEYPYSYIVKARDLGITKTVALPNTSFVKRKDVALLLYNALFVTKADGTTAARDAFGIDTYVVTAANNYNLTGVKAYLAGGKRVVVQPLNADGTINDMYYHLPTAAFKERGLVPVLGASYRIASTDNLETVKAITPCPTLKLSHNGNQLFLSANGNVNISDESGKGVNYIAVERYTKVYNTQGTQSGKKEIIVYNQKGVTLNAERPDKVIIAREWFKTNHDKVDLLRVDEKGNLIGKNGEIIAYYRSNDKENPYQSYNEETKEYTPVTEEFIWENVSLINDNTSHHDQISSLRTDAFGNILDSEGYIIAYYMPGLDHFSVEWPYFGYDEATDTYYPVDESYVWTEAGQIQDNSTRYIIWTKDEIDPSNGLLADPDSSRTLSNKNSYYSAVAYDDDFDGDYDRLFYSFESAPVNGKRTSVSGLVTSVDEGGMTIAGQKYGYYYPQNANGFRTYIGKNVKATLIDEKVYSIGGCSSTWIIFEDYTGVTRNGYVTAYAFSGSSEIKPIAIASIDGAFFMHTNYMLPTSTDVNNFETFYDRLQTGKLYTAVKDYYGYYHISTEDARGETVEGEWANETTIKFKNGISSEFNIPSGSKQRLQSKKEYIFYDPDSKTFMAGKGFPADGSTIKFASLKSVAEDGKMTLVINDCVHIKGDVIYFSDAKFNGTINSEVKKVTQENSTDVVYLSANAAEQYSIDQKAPNNGETIVGFRYVYSEKAFSLISGEYVSICTGGIYNYRLEEGFYVIHNGVVDRKIVDFAESGCPIASGTLEIMDIDNFRLVETAGSTGGSTDKVYEEELIKCRLYPLGTSKGNLVSGGSWSTLSSFRSSKGISSGTPVRVFYAKATMTTSSPLMIAITDSTGEGLARWNLWGGN